MKHANLAAEPRTIIGKKVARLRRAGKVPANIYGHNVESTAVTLDGHDFGLLYRHLLPTTIIDLRLNGQARPVLLDRATTDPRTGSVIHVEFKQVNLREKVHATVPVVGTGQSPLMEIGEGILLQALDTVSVSALPDDLPPSIEVSLTPLVDFHATIQVKELPLDRSIIEILTPGDELVFKLTPPQVRDEEAEEAAEAEGEAELAAEAGEEAATSGDEA